MAHKIAWTRYLSFLMRQRDVNGGALIAIDGRIIINSPNFQVHSMFYALCSLILSTRTRTSTHNKKPYMKASQIVAVYGAGAPRVQLTPDEAKLLLEAASAVTPAQQRPFRTDLMAAGMWYPHTDYYKEGRSPEGYTFVAQSEQQVLAATRAWKGDGMPHVPLSHSAIVTNLQKCETQEDEDTPAVIGYWLVALRVVILVGVHFPKENEPENSYIPINVVEGTRLVRRRINEREAH